MAKHRSLPSRPQPQAPTSQGWRSLGLRLVAIAGLVGGFAGAIAAVRISYQLVVNPGSVPWIGQVVPGWQPPDYRVQQSVAWQELQQTLAASAQQAGTPIRIDPAQASEPRDWLIPIVQPRPNCQSACDQIVAVRMYRALATTGATLQASDRLFLVDQLPIAALSSTRVLTPLHTATDMRLGAETPLPLTQVTQLSENAPAFARWFVLTGTHTTAGQTVRYGQMIPYSPEESSFLTPVTWSSPANQLPVWRSRATAPWPDLVVNQTVGIAPHFDLQYWVAPANQPTTGRFVAVDLTAAIDSGPYQQGLLLARHELWSLAARRFQSLNLSAWAEETVPRSRVEAQRQWIALHAAQTHAQAEQTWSSPSQKILAQLMDNRWQAALDELQRSPWDDRSIKPMLLQQSALLRDRLAVALQITPQDLPAQVWSALLLALQRDPTVAIAWIREQSSSPQTATYQMRQALAQLNGSDPTATTATTTTPPPATRPTGRVIGMTTAIASVQWNQWQRPPGSAPSPTPAPAWYQIQVLQWHDGQRWQTTVPAAGTALWEQVKLPPQAALQLWLGETNQTPTLTLQAVRVQAGQLYLLASGADYGAAIASASVPPLTMTAGTLEWIALPTAQSLADLYAQSPATASPLITGLWQELRQAQYVLDLPSESLEQLISQLGGGVVQPLDLAGDGQRVWMVSLYPQQVSQLIYATDRARQIPPTAVRTVILDSQGRSLYSNLAQSSEQLVAIARRDQTPFLVVAQNATYRLVPLP